MCLVNPNKTTHYTAPIRRYLNMMETYVPQNKLRTFTKKTKIEEKKVIEQVKSEAATWDGVLLITGG